MPTAATALAHDTREVVVCWVPLRAVPAAVLDGVLSDRERARARRLRFRADRTRFAGTRFALRRILAERLGMEPAAVPLEEDARGKPMVRDGAAGGLQFNVSHSGRLAVIAMAIGRRVGVDVESLRDVRDWQRLAERFLPAADAAAVRAAPAGVRAATSIAAWTRAEARLKADGAGLAGLGGEPDPAFDVRALVLPDPYVGAIAVEGTGWSLGVRAWVP